MYKCAVFISLLMLIDTRDISFAPSSIPRPNYGVQFIREGTILNGQSEYKHTFGIKIPKFFPANYSRLDCNNIQTVEDIECDLINEQIKRAENIINLIRERNNEEIEQAKKLIPESNIVPPTDNSRKKRNADESLGKNFCQDLSEGKIKFDEGFETEAIPGMSLVRSFFTSLSGSTTNADKQILASHICELSKQGQLGAQEILEANKRLDYWSKVFNERIENIKSGIKIEEDEFKHYSNQMFGLLNNSNENLKRLLTRIQKSEIFIMYTVTFMNKLFQIQLLENSQSEWCRDFVYGMLDLNKGRLSPHFVSVKEIEKVLDHVRKDVLPQYDDEFQLTHENPAFYYEVQSISYTRSNDYLYIMLSIPIHAIGGLLAVYRLDVTHVPITHNNTASTFIKGLPDYFATTLEAEYYTELSADQYNTCKGDILKVCSSQTSLRRSNQKTCAASIFYDDPSKVLRECDIRYRKQSSVGQAKKMPDNTYLVHKSNENDNWNLICPHEKSKHKIQSVKTCNYCFLQLPCRCKLIAKDFYIPHELSGCNFNDSEEQQITYKYGINLPTIRELNISLTNLAGDTLKNEIWQINIPTINITESSEWKDVVENDEQDNIDFKRVMQQQRNESEMFKTKSDFLFREANKWSEHGNSVLRQVQKFFGSYWLSDLFHVKIVSGSVGLTGTIATLSLVLGCYNCYMVRRGY